MTSNFTNQVAAPEIKAASAPTQQSSEPQENNKTGGGRSGSEKESQASQLIEIGKQAELFHTPSSRLYATVRVNGHFENQQLTSSGFGSWLMQQFFRANGRGAAPQALDEALTTLKAIAQFDGREHDVFIRVAEQGGAVYLDLANDQWQAVKITEAGWSVINNPPIKFIRAKGMLPLPLPVRGGNINELRTFVNVANDDDFKLMVAWVLAAFTYGKPYPVLILGGEQGCSKSTTTKILRELIDPNTAPLRKIPGDQRNFAVMSNNSHVFTLDNLSGLPRWVSDHLCCLSTGAAFSARKNYTDDEEMIFQAMRPVILNGIGDVGTASDLLDRSILLTLPVIGDRYLTESEIWANFDQAQPRILGALLDVVAHGLRNFPHAPKHRTARMADFAAWIAACEPALGWDRDSFIKAYTANHNQARQVAIEASPIAEPVRALVKEKIRWVGSATELLELLNSRVNETVYRRPEWPRSPEKLASLLQRIAPDLRSDGIEVKKETRDGGTGKRRWLLEDVEKHKAATERDDVDW